MSIFRTGQLRRAWLLAATFALSSAILLGQSDNASVSGFVRDSTGASIPAVRVVLTNTATGAERETKTGDNGYYIFTPVPSGVYTVSAEATGFKKTNKTKNKIDSNMAAGIDLTLEVGDLSQSVEVTASATRIQTDTAALGRVVDRAQFESIQVTGRNPMYLALLKPGVTGQSVTGGGFGMANIANINGTRSSDSTVTTDGAVGLRTRGADGTAIGAADMDAVAEIQILTSAFPAEYGRSIGGQVRIITRSGGQQFHGSLYEYFRNSALNANTWDRNRNSNSSISGGPSPFRYNQFGYNVNGPVYLPGKWNTDKSKLFFLFSQEYVRQRSTASTTQTVATAAMRNGDFSELLNPANTFYTGARTINDPTTNSPFAGNLIPKSRLSANGVGILSASQLPTPGFLSGSNNYYSATGAPTNQRKETYSIDYNPSSSHQLRFRSMVYSYWDYSPFDGSGHTPRIFDRPNKSFSLNYIWTVSPTMVNEMLATTSVDQVFIGIDTSTGVFDRTKYGINYPYIFPDRKEITNKIPTAAIAGFTGINGGPYPAKSAGPIYMLSDNFTIIKNTHTIKFGGLYERAGQNDFDQINVTGVPGGTNNQNGRFEFNDGSFTGLAVANAAMGLFSNYAELGARPYTPYRSHMFEWFAQDSWKVTDKLRLEIGLRHSIIQPYYSQWRNMAVFDPASYDVSKAVVQDPKTGAILSGNYLNGMIIPGDGWPDSAKGRVPIATSGEYNSLFKGNKEYSKIHYADFQPRLGIAYTVTPKMVVRAGGGRFYTRTGVSDSVFLGANAPFQPNASVANGSVDNPGAAAANARLPLFVTTQDPIFRMPSAWSWNTAVERELPWATTLEVSYVGRRGIHLQRERNINQLMPGTLQNSTAYVDTLRPYKGYATIRVTNNEASSTYNALQVSVNRRFSKGLSYGLAYTYGKSTDDASGSRTILPNAYDASTFWGPSDFDVRQMLVVNFIYELPVFRNNNLSGKLLGGWQLSSVNQFQTGNPFTVSTSQDVAGVGTGSGNQIWDIKGDAKMDSGDQKFAYWTGANAYWFRTTAADGTALFQRAAAGTFTTQNNRNKYYRPGSQSWNVALFKAFSITEQQRVQFRAEMYNFPNHPNWDAPVTDPTNSAFGKVTTKSSNRTMQLSLRYSF
ncbi:TonB-dependent receptor [Paludibaculum fermentans]|uniref:Carboxypeptidase regulatory-like domain-containing protein n=1 Tax=Paludibaculum fermentans TaxID=1473598 RepID=A0A7S7NWY4_PALFE|nr:carboxypeptidase-like regulatory domain-containing protein [Paludibaculum fermentans]QOY91323.1 carboxypeptidase regulatory-like domain-containing protein [Paludibaculum fermentans]